MADLGRRAEREVVCLLTDMDQPLGHAVGHALEVREAVATIQGEGPEDFTELVLEACARLLSLSDLGIDVEDLRLADSPGAVGSARPPATRQAPDPRCRASTASGNRAVLAMYARVAIRMARLSAGVVM